MKATWEDYAPNDVFFFQNIRNSSHSYIYDSWFQIFVEVVPDHVVSVHSAWFYSTASQGVTEESE